MSLSNCDTKKKKRDTLPSGRRRRLGDRLCGREVPADPLVSRSERSSVLFQSNGAANGDGFKVRERLILYHAEFERHF